MSSDITIIGGGIIGLMTAKEFVQAGCSVTVIDKTLMGQESSWAGGGILLPLYPWRQPLAISTLVLESTKKYPSLAATLLNSTQIDCEWTKSGMLISQNTDIEVARQWCARHHIPYQSADTGFFKSFNSDIIAPLWLPTVAQIHNPRLLKALKTFLRQQGVQLLEHCEITDCGLKNARITHLKTSQGTLNVKQLVISAGAWTSHLSKQLLADHLAPEIVPIKGQMLLFGTPVNTLSHIMLEGDYYLIPRRDGKILVGSSVEYCQFDKSTTSEVGHRLYHFATTLLPALKKYPLIGHWAGLRPGTKLGIPYIDKHPHIKNLSINAGHFRNGLAMAPSAAKLLVDLIMGRQPSIDPTPYKLN